jgi:hypothetical protein
MKKCFTLALLVLLVCASATEAQNPPQRRYRRRYDPQAEALRLLFGPNGLPALTRPADPWNRRRAYPRYVTPYNRGYNRPYYPVRR